MYCNKVLLLLLALLSLSALAHDDDHAHEDDHQGSTCIHDHQDFNPEFLDVDEDPLPSDEGRLLSDLRISGYTHISTILLMGLVLLEAISNMILFLQLSPTFKKRSELDTL
jgi:hypothetical protein